MNYSYVIIKSDLYYFNIDRYLYAYTAFIKISKYKESEKYIDKTLQILTTRYSKDYYAQMAIAWALSICYVNFFDKVSYYLFR